MCPMASVRSSTSRVASAAAKAPLAKKKDPVK
jgi:hypothetical protein